MTYQQLGIPLRKQWIIMLMSRNWQLPNSPLYGAERQAVKNIKKGEKKEENKGNNYWPDIIRNLSRNKT